MTASGDGEAPGTVSGSQDGSQGVLFELGPVTALNLGLAKLTQRVEELERVLKNAGADPADPAYEPVPSPKWWIWQSSEQMNLIPAEQRRREEQKRDRRLARLHHWVENVWKGSYGHLAATLGDCWPEHPLCLGVLDVLMEQHACLYTPQNRSQALVWSQQAWYAALPQLADLMKDETRQESCMRHQRDSRPAALVAVAAPVAQ